MYRKQVPVRHVCKSCDVRIPQNRPKLVCCFCNEVKHYRCEKLSKNDAISVIATQPHNWVCHGCMLNTLPINACWPTKRVKSTEPKFSITCFACQGRSYSESNVKICTWCDNTCHAKCVKGILGCTKCCENTIPGLY